MASEIINALQWFKSYLNERSQYVTVNGHASEMLPITCGIPQGSVPGPLLFLIYVNDLPNASKLLSFYLFADDTSIYFDSLGLIQTICQPFKNCQQGVKKKSENGWKQTD